MKKVKKNTDQALEYIISYTIYNDGPHFGYLELEFVFFIYDSVNGHIYNTSNNSSIWSKYTLNDRSKKPSFTNLLYKGGVVLNNILEECSDTVKKEIFYNIYVLECKDTNELRKFLAY